MCGRVNSKRLHLDRAIFIADPENRVAIAGIREEGRKALPKGYCQRSGDKRPRNQSY